MANSQRATIFAIKEETTVGVPVLPTAGSDFIPLRAGFTVTANVEELTSDELVNDIGATKGAVGKESPTGSHPIYLKHSETEGVAPEYGLLIESCLGAKSTAAAEFDTVAGSTTSVLNVGAGEGATFEVGEAVLVKEAGSYAIRNISSISRVHSQSYLKYP